MPTRQIRPAQPSDIHAIVPLAIASKAVWGYGEDEMKIFREELTFSSEQLVKNHGHVAVDVGNDQIVGYYTLVPHSADVIELDHLFAHRDRLREGTGEALLAHAVRHATSLGHERMKIISDPSAAPFYEKMGAVRTGDHQSSIPERTIPILEISLR